MYIAVSREMEGGRGRGRPQGVMWVKALPIGLADMLTALALLPAPTFALKGDSGAVVVPPGPDAIAHAVAAAVPVHVVGAARECV